MRVLNFCLDVQLSCPRSQASLDAFEATRGGRTQRADAQHEIFSVYLCRPVIRPGGNRYFFRFHAEFAERKLDGGSVLSRR